MRKRMIKKEFIVNYMGYKQPDEFNFTRKEDAESTCSRNLKWW